MTDKDVERNEGSESEGRVRGRRRREGVEAGETRCGGPAGFSNILMRGIRCLKGERGGHGQ